jgi:DNA-binding IclR family transcriptional regulator
MDARKTIETGLGSIGKIKIIRVLAEEQKMATVYLLHNKTRLKREDIKSNLDDLVRLGWVNQTRYANVMYSINMENPYVSKLVDFLREVGYVGQS